MVLFWGNNISVKKVILQNSFVLQSSAFDDHNKKKIYKHNNTNFFQSKYVYVSCFDKYKKRVACENETRKD